MISEYAISHRVFEMSENILQTRGITATLSLTLRKPNIIFKEVIATLHNKLVLITLAIELCIVSRSVDNSKRKKEYCNKKGEKVQKG